MDKDNVSAATTTETIELISDQVRKLVLTLNFAYICQLIDVVGTGANVVNIICFVKQGFRETVNISLFGKYFSQKFTETYQKTSRYIVYTH